MKGGQNPTQSGLFSPNGVTCDSRYFPRPNGVKPRTMKYVEHVLQRVNKVSASDKTQEEDKVHYHYYKVH
eukprot:scaffold4718_cov201-Alexandrium_tamarense.AAC.4